jgi:hypothetical protein
MRLPTPDQQEAMARTLSDDAFRRTTAKRPWNTVRDYVRYWPKADMSWCTAHVRFRGESGHGQDWLAVK